eukprot:scaffold80854_cov54-Phaeocystis_antarctica.AAC.2
MLIGTCQTAQPLFGCRAVRSRFFTTSPLTSAHAPLDESSARRAASRTPARAIEEGRGARPRATDEQLVGVVQGVCALPSRKEGMCCGRRYGPRGRATVAQAACRGEGSTAVSGAGHGEERTSNM